MVQQIKTEIHEPKLVAVRVPPGNDEDKFEIYGVSMNHFIGSKEQITVLIPSRWLTEQQFELILGESIPNLSTNIDYQFLLLVVDVTLVVDSIGADEVVGIIHIIKQYDAWLKLRQNNLVMFEIDRIRKLYVAGIITIDEVSESIKNITSYKRIQERKESIVQKNTRIIEEESWIQKNTSF